MTDVNRHDPISEKVASRVADHLILLLWCIGPDVVCPCVRDRRVSSLPPLLLLISTSWTIHGQKRDPKGIYSRVTFEYWETPSIKCRFRSIRVTPVPVY